MLISGKFKFTCVNHQNFRYWSGQNPRELHEKPLHNDRVTAWCAVARVGIPGPYFFEEDGATVTVNSQRYSFMINNFLAPILNALQIDQLRLIYEGRPEMKTTFKTAHHVDIKSSCILIEHAALDPLYTTAGMRLSSYGKCLPVARSNDRNKAQLALVPLPQIINHNAFHFVLQTKKYGAQLATQQIDKKEKN
ncbi:hypothetical protein ANN_25829 [Periplaneta americana]|uniref:Uncharacterized protein n=1 Tax=Periplaneta americana TaxID=6978 RepID=A0ABQ8S4P2_PERAM|nr:hypothetical protein ANN_25829 [Periplaneta americana]